MFRITCLATFNRDILGSLPLEMTTEATLAHLPEPRMILAGASAMGFFVQDLLVTTMLFVRDLAFMSGREVQVADVDGILVLMRHSQLHRDVENINIAMALLGRHCMNKDRRDISRDIRAKKAFRSRIGNEYLPNQSMDYGLPEEVRREYTQEGERALQALRSYLNSTASWDLEEDYPEEEIVVGSQFQPRLGMYFLYTEAVLNYDYEWTFRKSWGAPGQNFEWYKEFSKNEFVQSISEECRIVHETTEPMLSGWIAARDFVSLVCHRKIGETIYWPFSNVTWPGLPPKDGIVRSVEHLGSGHAFSPHKTDKNKSVFQWINGMGLQVPFVPISILKKFAAASHRHFILALRSHLDAMAASSL
ncbi:unnamed protein product [Darwinula stevensoni]|uniref:START domain-containing protein n=1 Tax=Darwinula stevensoni TaxID=69355 RepID=A0A7R9AC08_9CRUS|nr:unnamed protein product [Darwinula stevensoni]CAG0899925.1 unnamed protein product [Darwinula stevensoni]